MALCATGGGEGRLRLTLQSVVTTREKVRGEPKNHGGRFSRVKGRKSFKKHLDFFTESEREWKILRWGVFVWTLRCRRNTATDRVGAKTANRAMP